MTELSRFTSLGIDLQILGVRAQGSDENQHNDGDDGVDSGNDDDVED
jgi:hypothetical protein